MDEAAFDGSDGFMHGEVLVEDAFELGAALAIQKDDVAGVEAVLEGVAGSLFASGGGDGSTGPGSVGSGDCGSGFWGHRGFSNLNSTGGDGRDLGWVLVSY